MKRFFLRLLVPVLLCVQAWLIGYTAWNTTPNATELGVFGSIRYFWTTGWNDVGHVNPPVTKWIAGVPFYIYTNADKLSAWELYSSKAQDRSEFRFGQDWFNSMNLDEIRFKVFCARMMLLPLILLAGYIGFRFGREVYGEGAGIIFLAVWSSSPFIVGWGATICTDVPAASMGIIGAYAFWRWCNKPSAVKTICAGVFLGLMILTKFTWIIAVPIWIVIYSVGAIRWKDWKRPSVWQFGAIFFVAWFTINFGFYFDGCFTKLQDYEFVSRALTGNDVAQGEPVENGNKFVGTALGEVPVPFAKEFVRGIDTQKLDFERGFTSYVNGVKSPTGWWWYYLYAYVLKEPLFMPCFFLAGLVSLQIFRKKGDLFFLAPAIMVFVFVSAQTGFSMHPRYIIPALPFVYLFIGRILLVDNRLLKWCIGIGVACVVMTGFAQAPYAMSSFNDMIPMTARPKILLGSNIDWGQAGYDVKKWCDENKEKRPLYVSYSWSINFEKYRIKDDGWLPEYKPQPGYIVVSPNDIYLNKKYAWLQKEKPIAFLGGGAAWVFHIEGDENE